MAAIIPLFQNLLSQSKINKTAEIAQRFNIPVNWLLAVYYFETAHTFSTAVTNSIGSVGLIQFTKDKAGADYKTINGKVYKLKDIALMDWNEQNELVYEYLKQAIGSRKITSFTDLYLAVFFPLAIGKSDDYTLATGALSAATIANQNPAFDTNKDKEIKKGEVTAFFKKQYDSLGIDFDTFLGTISNPGVDFGIIALIVGVFFSSVLNVLINL